MYLERAVSGYRAHSCYKAQLALALFRRGGLHAAMGDSGEGKASFTEAKQLYSSVSGRTWNREDEFDLTEEELIAVVPLSSR